MSRPTEMPVEWHRTRDKLPLENQECLLMSKGGNVLGPIMWKVFPEGGGAWMDLFATPEAGSLYSTDVVAAWTAWEPIAPSDAFIDSLEDQL